MSGTGNTFSSGAEYASGTVGRFGARSARGPPFRFRTSSTTRQPYRRVVGRSVQRSALQQRANVAVPSARWPGRCPVTYPLRLLAARGPAGTANQGVVGDLATVFLRTDGDSNPCPSTHAQWPADQALKRIPKRMHRARRRRRRSSAPCSGRSPTSSSTTSRPELLPREDSLPSA